MSSISDFRSFPRVMKTPMGTTSVFCVHFYNGSSLLSAKISSPLSSPLSSVREIFIRKVMNGARPTDYGFWLQTESECMKELKLDAKMKSISDSSQLHLRRLFQPIRVKHWYRTGIIIDFDLRKNVSDLLDEACRSFCEKPEDVCLAFKKKNSESIVIYNGLPLFEQSWNGEQLYLLPYRASHNDSSVYRIISLGLCSMPRLEFAKIRSRRPDSLPPECYDLASIFRTNGAHIILSENDLIVDGSQQEKIALSDVKVFSRNASQITVETSEKVVTFPLKNSKLFELIFKEKVDKAKAISESKRRSSVGSYLIVIGILGFIVIFLLELRI